MTLLLVGCVVPERTVIVERRGPYYIYYYPHHRYNHRLPPLRYDRNRY